MVCVGGCQHGCHPAICQTMRKRQAQMPCCSRRLATSRSVTKKSSHSLETVTRHVSVPVCIYDNPGTTHFIFTDELHGLLSSLEGVRSLKIPGVPDSPAAAAERVGALRQHLRPGVTIGISGDAYAGLGLNAGCEVWYSVSGGLFPETAKQITEAAAANEHERVTALTTRLEPFVGAFP